MLNRILYVGAAIVLSVSVAQSQQALTDQPEQPESKHIFWIIPNFRTAPLPAKLRAADRRRKIQRGGGRRF